MKTWQRIVAGLAAIVMLGSLSSCKKENEEIPYTLEEVLTHFADETKIDEVLSDQNDLTNSEKLMQDFTFAEKVSLLEIYIETIDKITELGIEPEKVPHKTTAEEYSKLTLKEVDDLISNYQKDSVSDIEKLRMKSVLGHMNYTYQEWVKLRGLNISINLLKRVIKAVTCEISGLEIEYYENCTIQKPSKDDEKKLASKIEVKDPICWDSLIYEIPRKNNIYASASDLIFEMRDSKKNRYDVVRDYSIEAIELTKLAMAAGVQSVDNQISSKLTEEQAKQKVLTMNEPNTTIISSTTKKED